MTRERGPNVTVRRHGKPLTVALRQALQGLKNSDRDSVGTQLNVAPTVTKVPASAGPPFKSHLPSSTRPLTPGRDAA